MVSWPLAIPYHKFKIKNRSYKRNMACSPRSATNMQPRGTWRNLFCKVLLQRAFTISGITCVGQPPRTEIMVWCGSAWLCMGFVFSLLRRHVVKTTDTGATQPDLRESKYVKIHIAHFWLLLSFWKPSSQTWVLPWPTTIVSKFDPIYLYKYKNPETQQLQIYPQNEKKLPTSKRDPAGRSYSLHTSENLNGDSRDMDVNVYVPVVKYTYARNYL